MVTVYETIDRLADELALCPSRALGYAGQGLPLFLRKIDLRPYLDVPRCMRTMYNTR